MKRGDVATVVLPGAYGKPRPGVIVQHDAFDALASVTLLPMTSDLRRLPVLRVEVAPGPEVGLRIPSEVQIDKIMTVPRVEIGRRLGALDEDALRRVEYALARFLGLPDPPSVE